MPKKPPKNSFYFFMIDFKEEQRKKGINYANMKEVADAAGPAWTKVLPPVRAKYEAIAKAEKQKLNVPEKKFTSTGISLAEIEQQEREKREAEEAERQDIRNIVKLKSFNGSIVTEDFYVMDVNYYCKCGAEYLIGEMTILRFNMKDGVRDHYHEMINPGRIPVGYALDVKLGSQEFGLEMPDESDRRGDYLKILGNIIDYLMQKDPRVLDTSDKTLPPIFTMPDKVAPVMDFIQQICRSAAEDDNIFRIYKLDTLFFTLINAIRRDENDGLPKESLALVQLKTDKFKYNPGLGCEHHEEGDKAVECTTSRTKRWAFTVLDMCCERVGVEPLPGRHVPPDFDVDTILSLKEEVRTRRVGVAGGGAGAGGSSCNSSLLNDSRAADRSAAGSLANSSLDSTAKKEKRKNAPLRMPTIDYSRQVLNPLRAPELTEAEFPSLSAGRGRGRNTSGSLNRLK